MRILKGSVMAVLPAILTVFVFMVPVTMAAEVPRMTVDEIKGLLDDPAIIVLDVRTEKDWQAADVKIRGAVRKDPKKVADWAGELDRTKAYVLYCA